MSNVISIFADSHSGKGCGQNSDLTEDSIIDLLRNCQKLLDDARTLIARKEALMDREEALLARQEALIT